MGQDPANESDRRRPQESNQAPRRRGLSVWQIAGSTLASAFGVQSSRNRERDFSEGRAVHFIIAGVVFTALFVLAVVLVVNLVLGSLS